MRSIVYWLKYLLFLMITTLRPLLTSSRTSGLGKRRVFTMVEKEQVRDFVKDGFSIDAAYFNGFDYNGQFLGLGMQRRPDGRCESVFFIRMPDVSPEPLVLSINPSTWTRHLDGEWTTDKGLRFNMREPMRRWSVSFEGEVVESVSRKTFRLKFDLEWNRTSAIFDADLDMDKVVISRAIAAQPWSREFFQNLKELHQTHYEVFGQLTGTVSVNESPSRSISLVSMKDRSYGKQRNWGDFRRYILHYLSSEDGLYIGCHFVSIPKTFSHLLVGFVVDARGNKVALRDCQQTLADIGDDSLPFVSPYSYDCVDTNGKKYHIEVRVVHKVKFFCGEHKDGTLYSAYVQGSINGVRMAGMCEYEYNSEQYAHMLDS